MSQTILVGSKPGFLLAIHSQSPLPPNNAVLEDQRCVEFSVPDLYTIAKKDNDHDAQQTIVCMNALNLKVYTHSRGLENLSTVIRGYWKRTSLVWVLVLRYKQRRTHILSSFLLILSSYMILIITA
jgi:hypothetical protein